MDSFLHLDGKPVPNVRYGFTEDEFDEYFKPALDNIRQVGPLWRRHALGNHADEK